MNPNFHDELVEARVYASLASTMFSYMMYECQISLTDDKNVGTAYALVTKDANLIVFRDIFWDSLDAKQRAFVILHEVLHIFLKHGERLTENMYEHRLWNIATDFYINYVLMGHYVGGVNERFTQYLSPPDEMLFDKRYVGMSSDEIYALLKQDSEKGGTDSIDEFDVVMPSDVGTEQQGQRNEQIAVNAATNASMMQDTIGKNEDHIVKRFTKLKTPVVSWRRLLTETIMHRGDSFLSYNRISRRTTDSVIFPVRRGTVINLVVGIDSSGSMTANDINTAISEIYGIIGSFDNFKLTIVSCDVGLRVLGTFENEIIPSIAPIGGGGTNMQPILDFAYELGLTEVVDSVIIMSDGHINNDDIDVATYGGDVIFMVTRNFDLVVPSATMVYMNEEKL